jgi:hypothetical protein
VDNDQIPERIFYAANSSPYGISYGHWTVKWWHWSLSTPKSINPATDDSGIYSFVNQPMEHVWFLAGKVGDRIASVPTRHCKIPASRSILFPVINCEASLLECPDLTSRQELINHVNADENAIVLKECFVDGNPIPVQRIKSDPLVFEVAIDENNIYGVQRGGITYAAADGYWVFLSPLPVGEHRISFRGSCENGRLNSGANYLLQIL